MRSLRARLQPFRGLLGVVVGAALAATVASTAYADDGASATVTPTTEWDAVRARAKGLVDQADRRGGGLAAAPLYERAGHLYMETFREACDAPVRISEKPKLADPTKCDEVAFSAARAFAAAHLRAKALATYRALLAFAQVSDTTTDLAARAMREIALSYQAIGIYDSAAEWHERYALDFPKDADAHLSLSDAAILRLGLSDEERALKDVDAYLKMYARSKPKETAAILLMIAIHHFEQGANEKSRIAVTSRMELFDRAPIDIRIRAHALAAKVVPSHAKEEWAVVRKLWSDPRDAEQELRMAWKGEEDWRADRRLAQVLTVVGDAIVAEADEKRAAEVDSLRYPTFSRTNDVAGIEAFVTDEVKTWFVKKRAAIEPVEAAYVKALEVRPIPAPRAVIASAAGVGKMWAGLADDLRSGPPGAAWRRDPKLLRLYVDAVGPLVDDVLRTRAKPTMKKCIELSVKLQFTDAPAHECEAWLVTTFPKEWHAVEEIVPGLRAGPRSMAVSPMPAWLDPL